MTDPLPVSVVVVSHRRPAELRVCLTALMQVDYAPMEIVVVADGAGLDAIADLPFLDQLKTLRNDAAGISIARNLGIVAAAGDIVAFIDDDAVPEPSWLRHLTEPFTDPDVAAAGGYVRGRNGISFQWKARTIAPDMAEQALDLPGWAPVVRPADATLATKTEGTNMAFRRDVLVALGGFDPAYGFYLDESDLNMRLARAGHATAIVPLAQVHHGFAASAHRSENRTPKTLFDVGASATVFLHKFCAEEAVDAAQARLEAKQKARLAKLRGVDAAQARTLLETLRAGIEEGRDRQAGSGDLSNQPTEPFKPVAALPNTVDLCLSGRVFAAKRLGRQARDAVAMGQRATVFIFSPTSLYHHMTFHPDGYWIQSGGLFGKSDRDDPIFQLWSFSGRLAREQARLKGVRALKG